MSTQTRSPAVSERRARLLAPTPPRRALVPAVLAVTFLVTTGVAQAVTPFIRQDDWAFLIPEGSVRGILSPSYYNLSEGRWLNSVWWELVGQHGTPTTAALTYAVGYVLLVAGSWRVLHRSGIRPRPVVDALLGVALFASCVWVQLLYWPGALTPSVLVAAAAVWLLPRSARTPRGLRIWFVVSGAGAVLTYPPVGVVLLAYAVVFLRDAPWRRVLTLVGAWVAGFVLGVAVAYALNLVFNGRFGLEIASWRQPNPLTSLDALVTNTGRWLSGAGAMWAAQWWVALVALVAGVLGWREATVRPRLQRLLVAFAVAAGLDVAQSLATGIVTEARGQLWTWLIAVLPVALLLGSRRPQDAEARATAAAMTPPAPAPGRSTRPVSRPVAVALLAVLAVGGVLSWREDIGRHQDVRQQYAAIATAATAHDPGTAAPTVVVYQDPALRRTRSGRIMASTLFMAVRAEQGNVMPRWCRGAECRGIFARADSGPVVRLGSVGRHADVVGVVVPTPPAWI
jgi:hypothetical protein